MNNLRHKGAGPVGHKAADVDGHSTSYYCTNTCEQTLTMLHSLVAKLPKSQCKPAKPVRLVVDDVLAHLAFLPEAFRPSCAWDVDGAYIFEVRC